MSSGTGDEYPVNDSQLSPGQYPVTKFSVSLTGTAGKGQVYRFRREWDLSAVSGERAALCVP